jgi:hypothetical protein
MKIEDDLIYQAFKRAMIRRFSYFINFLEERLKNEIDKNKVILLSNKDMKKSMDMKITNEELVKKYSDLFKELHQRVITSLLVFIDSMSRYKDKESIGVKDQDLIVEAIGNLKVFFNNIDFDNEKRKSHAYLLLKKDREYLKKLSELQREFLDYPKDFNDRITKIAFPDDKVTLDTNGYVIDRDYKARKERERREGLLEEHHSGKAL